MFNKITVKKGSERVGFEQVTEGEDRLYIYTDISPKRDFPFGNPYWDNEIPFVEIAQTPVWQAKGDVDTFWKTFAERIDGPYKKEFKPKKAYKAYVAQMNQTLPEEPGQRLVALANDFKGRMRAAEDLPEKELEKFKKKRYDINSEDKYYNWLFENGVATWNERIEVFFMLARDCNIPFKLAFPTSSEGEQFAINNRSSHLIETNMPIFITASEEGMTQVIPYNPKQPTGAIPPKFQGMPAMILDPFNEFKVTFEILPVATANMHTQANRYTMSLTEDHTLSMQLSSEFTGQFRRNMHAILDMEEGAHLYKKSWEEILETWELNRVHIEEPVGDASIKAEIIGSRSLETYDSDVVPITPFPATVPTIPLPYTWLENRTQPIFLEFPQSVLDESVITVPEGYLLVGENQWQKSNDMGELLWMASQEGNQITVRRRFVLFKHLAPATMEYQLRDLLAWLEESLEQRIAVSKGANQ